MTDDYKPRPPIALAALVAMGIVAVAAGAYFLIPGADAGFSTDCRDAAEYHMGQATTDEESNYHFRAGQAYLILDELDGDCSAWEQTKETTTNEP